MTTARKIKYCAHHEIDANRWDQCIEESDNGLIYAHSFYLDIMAGKWGALILNDYEAVMPLTWNRKYGFYYLYQPYFISSLGVFGKKISAPLVVDFLNHIPKRFSYWDIDLNETNNFAGIKNDLNLKIVSRTNYLLNLDKPYMEIVAGYSRLGKRRIQKTTQYPIYIEKNGKPVDVVEFYRKNYGGRHENIHADTYNNLIDATTICFKKGLAKIYLAKLPDGELAAAYLVLVDKNFVYSLIGGSSETGRQTGAFYFLTDAAIQDHAGSLRSFRFEGSDLKGIAFFDAQFGATEVNYLHVKRNALPFPINLLKK